MDFEISLMLIQQIMSVIRFLTEIWMFIEKIKEENENQNNTKKQKNGRNNQLPIKSDF